MTIWAVIYLIVVYAVSMYKLPYDMKRAQTDTETTGQLADTITNNFNIKIFSKYALEYKRFKQVLDNQFRARKKSGDIATYGEIFQSAFMISLEFILIYAALRFWQDGLLTVGDLALIQIYLIRLFDQLWDAGKNIRTIYEAIADANEMTEILLSPHSVQDAKNAKP